MCSATTINSLKGTYCTVLYFTVLFSNVPNRVAIGYILSCIFLMYMSHVHLSSYPSVHLTVLFSACLPFFRYCDAKPSAFGQKADVRGSSNEAELKLLIEGTVWR